MTKILVDREVLERVLEALALAERTSYSETNQDKFIAAADKLRALLDTPSEPKHTTGHCANHAMKGGCQLHNLQCGYPACDRKETPMSHTIRMSDALLLEVYYAPKQEKPE